VRYLRNYTEDVVRHYIDKWLPQSGVCQCENCRMDIMAIMLNKLPCHYVVSDQGSVYAQLQEFDPQYKANVTAIMTTAIEIVKKNPHH